MNQAYAPLHLHVQTCLSLQEISIYELDNSLFPSLVITLDPALFRQDIASRFQTNITRLKLPFSIEFTQLLQFSDPPVAVIVPLYVVQWLNVDNTRVENRFPNITILGKRKSKLVEVLFNESCLFDV